MRPAGLRRGGGGDAAKRLRERAHNSRFDPGRRRPGPGLCDTAARTAPDRVRAGRCVVDGLRRRRAAADAGGHAGAAGRGDAAGAGAAAADVAGVEHVLRLRPEICTLDLVTAQVFGGIVISTEPQLTRMATLVREAGVKPEIELFDAGDAVLAKHLIGKGALDGPGMYSFVMGLNFTMPADTATMLYIRNLLPTGAQWQGFGIGRLQMPMALQSALLGGHVRVGMEDNAYIRRGQFASSNAEQVRLVRGMVEALGPAIASPAQARRILGLAPR